MQEFMHPPTILFLHRGWILIFTPAGRALECKALRAISQCEAQREAASFLNVHIAWIATL